MCNSVTEFLITVFDYNKIKDDFMQDISDKKDQVYLYCPLQQATVKKLYRLKRQIDANFKQNKINE